MLNFLASSSADAISVIHNHLPRLRRWWGLQAMEPGPSTSTSTTTLFDHSHDNIHSKKPANAKRISWAAEPFVDEDTPLLDTEDGSKVEDNRPRRKSRRNSFKELFKRRLNSSRNPGNHNLDESIEEEDTEKDSRGILWMTVALIILCGVAISATLIAPPRAPIVPISPPPPFPNQHSNNPAVLVQAENGAVATENPLCSKIGVQTLKDGGNAIDAAISSTLCIGVVNMFSSGIGGGGFMTVRIPHDDGSPSEVYTIDFREKAPAASNSTMYENDPVSSIFGGLSVGVPSELRGLEEAHKRWGNLSWKKLVQPSIDLADGWIVGPELARRIQIFAERMLTEPDWSSIFAPDGRLLVEGDPIARPALARTLEAIAKEGPDVFYKGPIADALLAKIKETGGVMTQNDLDTYKIRFNEAVKGTYRGRSVYTTDAPSSGRVLLHMLNVMEHFEDLIDEGRTGLNTHRLVEALKFGMAARTRVSDAVHKDDIIRMSHIDTKDFADQIFANMTDDITHPPEYYNPVYDVPIDHGTSHTTVIDKGGMVVSLTSSINLVFGSGVLDPVTGVILNDEMDDFSKPGHPNYFGFWPSPYNYPAPGKRPLSSMAPTIIEDADGNFELAVGGSGGSRIFGAIFQVILGFDWGLDISQAIEFPRVHDQLFPTVVDIDSGLPQSDIYALIDRGHNVTVLDINRITSVIQAVSVRNGTIFAASDSRKNGIAAGY